MHNDVRPCNHTRHVYDDVFDEFGRERRCRLVEYA
jgi:hypothetical protein